MIKNKSQVNKDLLDSLKKEEFSDIKIEALDGEVKANKTILSIRSEYFSRMLSPNNNFRESSTGRVKLPYPKVVVEKVVTYLYSGEMDCDDMELGPLLDLMELLKMINLTEEVKQVERYTDDKIFRRGFFFQDCLKNLEKSFKIRSGTIWFDLIMFLRWNLDEICDLEEVAILSDDAIFELLLFSSEEHEDEEEDKEQTVLRFKTYVTWLSVNSMTADSSMKECLLYSFNFDHFTVSELATDVKNSGLYPSDKIIQRMDQLFKEQEDELEALKMENSALKEKTKKQKKRKLR